MKTSVKTIGFAAAILSAATYGLNPFFAMPLYGAGFTPDGVLLWRYTVAAFLLALILGLTGNGIRASCREFCLSGVAGLLVALSSLFLFMSYQKMDVGIASTLLFLYPLMTACIQWIFYKERLNWGTWLALLMSLLGIALLYKKADGTPLNLWGLLFVFISALTYALFLVLVHHSRLQKMDSVKMTFFMLGTGAVFFLCRYLFIGSGMGQFTLKSCCNILGLAIFPSVISFWGATVAIKRVGATVTGILGALEPVTAIVTGVCLFGEILSFRICIGIALILLAVMTAILTQKEAKK